MFLYASFLLLSTPVKRGKKEKQRGGGVDPSYLSPRRRKEKEGRRRRECSSVLSTSEKGKGGLRLASPTKQPQKERGGKGEGAVTILRVSQGKKRGNSILIAFSSSEKGGK